MRVGNSFLPLRKTLRSWLIRGVRGCVSRSLTKRVQADRQKAGVEGDFEIARKITHGTKHSNIKILTRVQAGFSSEFSYAFGLW